jgi:hypothetical protein
MSDAKKSRKDEDAVIELKQPQTEGDVADGGDGVEDGDGPEDPHSGDALNHQYEETVETDHEVAAEEGEAIGVLEELQYKLMQVY